MRPAPSCRRAAALAFLVSASSVLATTAPPPDDQSVLQLRLECAPGAPGATEWVLRGPAGRGETIHLGAPVLDGSIVASAEVVRAPDGSPEIRLVLTREGSEALTSIAMMFSGRRLGIVTDGVLRSVPLIRTPARLDVLTVGGFRDEAEASRLARRLGPPPVAPGVRITAGTGAPLPRELDGSWAVRTIAVEGRPRNDAELDGATFTFREGRLTIAGRDGKAESFSLQAEKGPPLALRLEPVSPTDAKAGWMIALPEGDRLTLAFGDNLAGRPSDFGPARKKVVLTLERRAGSPGHP